MAAAEKDHSLTIQIFGGTEEEAATRAFTYALNRSAYRCVGCERVFVEGDTVYLRRKREFYSAAWELKAACLDCAAQWHPSWMEHRRKQSSARAAAASSSPPPTPRCRERAPSGVARTLPVRSAAWFTATASAPSAVRRSLPPAVTRSITRPPVGCGHTAASRRARDHHPLSLWEGRSLRLCHGQSGRPRRGGHTDAGPGRTHRKGSPPSAKRKESVA